MTGSHKHGHGDDHRHVHRHSHISEHAELTSSVEHTLVVDLHEEGGTPERQPGKSRRKSKAKKS